ncbi:MAG: 2-phospho-L-lactate guanylyltransferase, partial [Pseudonocardiaceae bacterium]
TTLLLAAPGTPLAPRFGAGSAAAHETGGAVPVGLSLPTLRCDVDTESDLAEARTLGLGRRTAALLRHDERFTRPTDEGCAVPP